MSESLCFISATIRKTLVQRGLRDHLAAEVASELDPSFDPLATLGCAVQAVSGGLVAVAHLNGGAHRVAGRGPPLLGWRQTVILWLPCLGGLSNFNTGKFCITLF